MAISFLGILKRDMAEDKKREGITRLMGMEAFRDIGGAPNLDKALLFNKVDTADGTRILERQFLQVHVILKIVNEFGRVIGHDLLSRDFRPSGWRSR